MTRYCTQNKSCSDTTSTRLWIHKRHPISRPHGELWGDFREILKKCDRDISRAHWWLFQIRPITKPCILIWGLMYHLPRWLTNIHCIQICKTVNLYWCNTELELREVISGVAQDCDISRAFAMELPQSCAKPSKCCTCCFHLKFRLAEFMTWVSNYNQKWPFVSSITIPQSTSPCIAIFQCNDMMKNDDSYACMKLWWPW